MSRSFRPGSSPTRGSSRFSGALRFGPSLVSASALIWAGAALADTTISTAVTAPVATSTAASGQPDNVIITGSVRPTSGAAVTLDSNNTVAITGGAVSTQNTDNTTGILIKGGLTGGVTSTGVIEYDETATPATNDKGIIDAPFATGTGRFGIRLIGPGAFTGVINNAAGGGITVQGNDSAGISLESALVGSVLNNGTMTVSGSRVFGIHTLSTVSGDVSSVGSITATGQGAQAIAVGGDVGGGVIVQGAITVTGYRYTTRVTDTKFLSELGPLELLQDGPAVSVAGNVGKGFLVAAPPTLDPNNTDVNGNGVADASETTGVITSYGAAPGVVVGAVGRNVSLGNVGTGATTAYGFVNNGTIAGFGVYDGVTAAAIWHVRDLVPLERIAPQLAARSTRIIAISACVAEQLEKDGVPAEKITVIYNGLDPDEWRPLERSHLRESLGIAEDAFVFGVVGQLVPWKNHAAFIAVAAEDA